MEKYGTAMIKTSWEKANSIEDNGKLHFNVYVYNVQDGIIIDYATGESKLAD